MTKTILTWTRWQAEGLAKDWAERLNAQIEDGVCQFDANWEWGSDDCMWARPNTISGEQEAYIIETDAERVAVAWLDDDEEECQETVENYLAETLCKDIECTEQEAGALVGLALDINKRTIDEDYCDDEQIEFLYYNVVRESIHPMSELDDKQIKQIETTGKITIDEETMTACIYHDYAFWQ